jgi:hypothetical protein
MKMSVAQMSREELEANASALMTMLAALVVRNGGPLNIDESDFDANVQTQLRFDFDHQKRQFVISVTQGENG